MRKIVLAFLLALGALALAGCETAETEGVKPSRNSGSGGDLPWNKPASWEGGLPGMPSSMQRQN